jgi:hypothetical protein
MFGFYLSAASKRKGRMMSRERTPLAGVAGTAH